MKTIQLSTPAFWLATVCSTLESPAASADAVFATDSGAFYGDISREVQVMPRRTSGRKQPKARHRRVSHAPDSNRWVRAKFMALK